MSLFEFRLPDIGEGVMEGEIVLWLVEPGQDVREDDPMVEVMTDKATVTIGAPKMGTIQELRAGVGEVVAVGSVIVTLALDGAPKPVKAAPAPARAAPVKAAPPERSGQGPAATAVGDIRETLPGTGFLSQPEPTRKMGSAPRGAEDHFEDKPLATPATRKLARDLRIDIRAVQGSGPGGRVNKDDVHAHANRPTTPGTTHAPTAPTRAVLGPTPVEPPSTESAALEVRTPFVGMRRKIAARMQQSKNTAAHFTFVEECDVGRLKALRARLLPAAEEAGVKLSFLPFIVKAVVAALRKHPVLNGTLDEATHELVTRRYYNIGIATATDMGLMVPVLKDADRMTLLEIASGIDRLGTVAREGSITPGELTGSTFTITSLGRQGGLFATPILNFPEVGILGVHRIKQRPVVRDGAIEIGEIMLLSLSFDHRIVDGHVGAAFAYDIIAYLEDPERLFLEMA